MFGWVMRLFRRTPRIEGVFHYRDGTRARSADPAQVELGLIAVLGADWKDHVRKLDRPPSVESGMVGEQLEAAQVEWRNNRAKILKAVDLSFGVKPYTDHGGTKPPEGLTDIDRLGLLAGFCLYCADLVELARPFGSAQSRASPSPESPPDVSGPESSSPAM